MTKTVSLFEVKHEDGIPYSNSPLFVLENPAKLDPKKPTIAILTWNNYRSKYNHVHGFVEEVATVLKKDHNIIYIGKEDVKNIRHLDNFYNFTLKEFHKINGTRFLRKKECEENGIDNVAHNQAELEKEFIAAFKNVEINKVIYANSSPYELPLTSYFGGDYKSKMNEFHDYVGTNQKEITERLNMAEQIANKFSYRVSVLAFTMFNKNIFTNLCIWLNKNHPINMNYSFVLDPVVFHKVFEIHDIPFKYFYFNDDKRGTRNFDEFPIAHLQHLINERRHMDVSENIANKTKNFFWMGSIIHERGIRSTLWNQFFDDLNIPNSSLWAPLRTNGVYFNKKQETSKFGKNSQVKAKKRFPNLVKSMEGHPMYNGHLLPFDVTPQISQYKYSLIMSCVSIEDSLNFRPIHYAYLRILPFLDPEYDPTYIQIPKKFQDKLLVTNGKDIQDRIDYYEANPKERELLLDQLAEFFNVEGFMKNWKDIVTKYFK